MSCLNREFIYLDREFSIFGSVGFPYISSFYDNYMFTAYIALRKLLTNFQKFCNQDKTRGGFLVCRCSSLHTSGGTTPDSSHNSGKLCGSEVEDDISHIHGLLS